MSETGPGGRKFVQEDEALVTVAQFYDPMRAQLAKGLLQANGVECLLQGENANQLLSSAFRARLKVMRADEGAARELLAETGRDVLVEDERALSGDEPVELGPGE